MQPIRILYLIDDLWSSRGGSEQHLLWLLNNIPDSEFEKHFVIFSTLWHPEPSILEHQPLVLGERYGITRCSWLRRLWALNQLIRKWNIDLIQAFSPMGEFAAVLASSLSLRCRVVGNRRDCGYDRRLKYRAINRLSRFFGTKYIANSEAARQAAFRNDRTPLESITVIRNPVATNRIQEGLRVPWEREKLPIPKKAQHGKIIGMVASVRPIKDYSSLIRATKIVLEKIPDTWLLCIGEPQENHKKELQHLADELGISERILWYGGIDNPLTIIPNFDVAVLSSHSESFSNSVLEYAVAECPIVVSNVGGLSEIIENNQTGFVVPPQNPQVLAEKIIQLLENPELGKTFGKRAKESVFEKYDEKKILEQYLNYYKSIVNT
ncbi:MAG: glycosyltransferase family 4 protein [Planctomycetaceae bacterium]|jgi:glycosyltransferase involved in cell wall biosynthesis|nr:glycosyltransferase family 4 protein [Planctomycetaceae bacterium]